MTAKITKSFVDKLESSNKDLWVWDLTLPGFGVRVFPGGAKSYVIRYRNAGGRQRKLTVGRCCDLNPDQARSLAREMFGRIDAGKDPLIDRRNERNSITVEDLARRYMAEHAPRKKPKSVEEDERIWRLHILPVFGSRQVMELQRADILAFHTALKNKPYLANRALALLSKALNLAEIWHYRTEGTNPCRHVKRYPEKPREKILTLEEMRTLGHVLDELEKEKHFNCDIVPLVRLLLYTGCRRSEIQYAKWEWVDFDRGLLMLPDAKAGWRPVTLSPQALSILKNLDTSKNGIFHKKLQKDDL